MFFWLCVPHHPTCFEKQKREREREREEDMRSNKVRLNCGITMPVLGMGTYSYENDKKTTELAIHTALKMGYSHFDTAKIYGSEPALGNALRKAFRDGVVAREDVWVTSKLWGSDHHDPVSALKESLKKLRMEYVDMYLVHWPVRLKPGASCAIPSEDEFEQILNMEETWEGMEKCLEMGMCRSIGVSNFSSTKIQQLLDYASVPPAVNQVEMHPMWKQDKLRSFCADNGIHVSAYSPLGGPGNAWGSTAVVEHPVIQSIAFKHNATPAQVALKWGLSKGSSLIVKSFNQDRMKENKAADRLKLGRDDIRAIDELEERKIMRGDHLINETTSPYKTLEDLWDDEI
ncbi:NADPH-dependent aldo-keto reductase, chloroplastic [Tripterygium wilfordii]|uniref:NADPH-dependent aldo-keto reductase, chloroplastic n=1 Tax=Tripterygium wilfordii TaxID=458696 RepID=UPI0018F800EF|nr:NADPH-dependent aldo-keto reductase, chloroplastic [Tripterygium wilfordii]XP_038683757.1 NADPH-dependent aldo-keto reductase, chloroplastic [Tripterygium wilfordii]